MHRRVDVVQGELVGRQLPVGVHVPFAQEEDELLLGERGIDAGQRNHVKGQVPGGVPGIFPLVGHGDDVAVEQVPPVAGCGPHRRLGGGGGWAGSPSSQSLTT